ncbi:hypothetical protein BWI75_07020 [Gloeocapsopsis sp. AAB1 = 1H9]|uniref:Uncharacterized protein n=1 Tax=Gloeocapsopsis dulcis AAB1 = 1H9 TaxID=1433147 RepID=A0A6N8FUV7_9CHRO|nr:hypothetical protein [Gloeocapsopsis dulcis AAB1 = 1H9]
MAAIGFAGKPVAASLLALTSNQDQYQIKWQGVSGQEIFGSYSIQDADFNKPVRVESIHLKLPHKVDFSSSKNSIVSATGFATTGNQVTVEIYKNGLKCGKTVMVGSGVPANKVCE